MAFKTVWEQKRMKEKCRKALEEEKRKGEVSTVVLNMCTVHQGLPERIVLFLTFLLHCTLTVPGV